jgi:hypothetical protein
MSTTLHSVREILKEVTMPAAMERKLKAQAAKRGFTGKRKDAFVYGTMRKTGWTPKREARHGALKRRLNAS